MYLFFINLLTTNVILQRRVFSKYGLQECFQQLYFLKYCTSIFCLIKSKIHFIGAIKLRVNCILLSSFSSSLGILCAEDISDQDANTLSHILIKLEWLMLFSVVQLFKLPFLFSSASPGF